MASDKNNAAPTLDTQHNGRVVYVQLHFENWSSVTRHRFSRVKADCTRPNNEGTIGHCAGDEVK